jgi:hypothetical protein
VGTKSEIKPKKKKKELKVEQSGNTKRNITGGKKKVEEGKRKDRKKRPTTE